MKIRLYPIALPLLLGLAACVTEYSKSEAPAALQVDGAQSRVEIAFVDGSDRLAPGEARRLDGCAGRKYPPRRSRCDRRSWPPGARRAARRGDFERAPPLRHRRQHADLRHGAGQSGDRSGRPLYGDLAGLPELEPVAGRRIHKCLFELLRLRQYDKPRPDGGEPRRPRQRKDARTGRRPTRRRRCRALYERSGQAAAGAHSHALCRLD